jgi:hypothetical protein
LSVVGIATTTLDDATALGAAGALAFATGAAGGDAVAACIFGLLARAVVAEAFPFKMSFSRCAADVFPVFPVLLLDVALDVDAEGVGSTDAAGAVSSTVLFRRSTARATGCDVWQKM